MLDGASGPFLAAFAQLRKATISFFVSVHPLVRMEKKKSAPTGRIFKKFGI
jgi:hypothetical protein